MRIFRRDTRQLIHNLTTHSSQYYMIKIINKLFCHRENFFILHSFPYQVPSTHYDRRGNKFICCKLTPIFFLFFFLYKRNFFTLTIFNFTDVSSSHLSKYYLHFNSSLSLNAADIKLRDYRWFLYLNNLINRTFFAWKLSIHIISRSLMYIYKLKLCLVWNGEVCVRVNGNMFRMSVWRMNENP